VTAGILHFIQQQPDTSKDIVVDLPSNPLAVLTFISAPAVLTNASSVLLFGTGNRYGRAIDRAHALTDMVLRAGETEAEEMKLRIRQLESAQTRTLLIVRALTCFYTAVAAFAASTLISLIAAILSIRSSAGISIAFRVAFLAGFIGILGMVTGALMLALESRFSFSVLRQENAFVTQRMHQGSFKAGQN
jgi:hypothetical protein